MPSASASEFMVEAGPLGLQWPIEGAEEATMFMNSSYSISPVANRSRAFQTTVPEPVRSPLNQPFNIGPPDTNIAGILTGAAAIRQAGVVLSQPVVRTTPSRG